MMFWAYLSPPFSLLQLTRALTLWLSEPEFSDTDGFCEASPLCLYPAKKTGDVVQAPKETQTDSSKHLHGSAIDIGTDGGSCSNRIRHCGGTCLTDVHIRHGYF